METKKVNLIYKTTKNQEIKQSPSLPLEIVKNVSK